MTGEELIATHREIIEAMHTTCKNKNADYAGQGGAQDAFANLRMVETLSKGQLTTEQGMFTRMTDKLSRLSSFLSTGNLKVKSESIEDTLLDLANYCILLVAYLRSKKTP